ncbi:MAG: hypothetical protein ABS894_00770 [Aerococcus urinaeequi]
MDIARTVDHIGSRVSELAWKAVEASFVQSDWVVQFDYSSHVKAVSLTVRPSWSEEVSKQAYYKHVYVDPQSALSRNAESELNELYAVLSKISEGVFRP